MKLSKLLERLEYEVVQGSVETEVTTLANDSRKVESGSVFVCISGAVFDGHQYVSDVAKKGAAAIIAERDIEVPKGVTVIKAENTRYALALMSAAYFGYPAEKLKVIGITGTKGKTTTTYLIRSILEGVGHKVGLIGTIEAIIGDRKIPAANTTPESFTIQQYFAQMVEEGCDSVVMEVSSQGLMLHRTAGKLSFWSDEIPVTGERREVINEDMVFGRTLYPVTCVSIGNPHCVIPMREISKPLVCKIGDYAEIARYFPNKINTQLLKVIDQENIQIEIFERGVGYTLASGSCACAAAGVAYKLGMTNPGVTVHMPGGKLQVEIQDDWEVFATGEVFYIGKISLSSEFGERLRAAVSVEER